MNSISANLNIMIKACEKASKTLIRDFGEVEKLQVSIKGPLDFVSNADTKAEKIIISELSKSRKNYSIISEEDGSKVNEDKNNVWIIDPIDGTTNFLHGIPHFAISIALKSYNEIVSGVIYDPIKDEMFYAEKNNGAYFNNQRIKVSKKKNLENCLFAKDKILLENKCEAIYWKTGHSHIKRKVNEIKALAGFEKSGHFFFNQPLGYGYDDGINSAIQVCHLLDNQNKKISEIINELPKTYQTPTMAPFCKDEEKYEVVESLVKEVLKLKANNTKIDNQKIVDILTVNGVRFSLEDGSWGLIRASSNKPSLVVVTESTTSDNHAKQDCGWWQTHSYANRSVRTSGT